MSENNTNKLVGHNYTTPDLLAKVTGKAKYAEDYRVEGMLFAKLLLSPMPHAKVVRIDTRAAMALPGVKAILTVDDLPPVVEGANLGEGIIASTLSERGLTNEPLYVGDPVLAVAAVDEATAAEAIEKIQVEFEPLPFVVDPIASLRPGGPNARTQGNVWVRPAPAPPARPGAAPAPAGPKVEPLKWTADDFAAAKDGQLPLGKHTDEWKVGDLDAAFKQADLILDETFVGNNTSHQPLETRTAMAYWQNGKLYMHCSTQSTMRTVSAVARWVGIDPANVVIISEYTGGGFGSKGSSSVFTAVAALLSKKANAPVMMRITREDEHLIGRARPAMHSRVKIGFRKDGRITALDGLDRRRQRPVRRRQRLAVGRRSHLAVLPADGDAVAHADRADQHAAARRAARAGRTAGQRADGADHGQSRAQARHRRGRDPPHQRARRQGAVRRAQRREASRTTRPARFSRTRSTRAPSCSTGRSGRRGADSARLEGARRRRGRQRVLGRIDGVRRAPGHHAGRPREDPVRHRQPRHRIGVRLPSRRRRGPRRAVGEMRRHLGQHVEEPAEHLRSGRQPDDARDDARGARGGERREEEAAGDRGEDARRQPRVVSGRQRARVRRRPQPDVRAGGAEGDRARRQVTTATSCRATSTTTRSSRRPRSRARG